MQLQYPPSRPGHAAGAALVLLASLASLLAAACGDNTGSADDDPGPGPGPSCSLDLAPADLDRGAWDPRFTLAGFTGPDGIAPVVLDFARDTDGSILAAGEFGYVGGAHVPPLMRWRGGAWEPARTTWELDPPGAGFAAVAVAPDGKLALATHDDFPPYAGEVWLDDGTGLRVIGRFEGRMRRLLWRNGQLWAAGWMELALNASAVSRGLAVWNGTAWNRPPGGAMNGFAHELAIDGTELLVGGDFTSVGGVSARSVAAYNGTAWRALSFPSQVAVYSLARGGDGALYAGGALGDLGGGDAAGGIARWTGTAWTRAGGGVGAGSFPGVVTNLTLHGGSLYAAGCFSTIGGGAESPGAIASHGVARWDGAWHALDDGTRGVLGPWFETLSCGDTGPDSVWDVSRQRWLSDGNRLLLAGSFPGIAGVASQALISFDGTTWSPEGPRDGLGLSGSLDRLGIDGASCELFGTGSLSHAGGAPVAGRVVRFDGTRWHSIADSIPRSAYCPAFSVSPLGGEVVLGCFESPAGGGDDVGRIYRVDGDHLVQVGGDLPLVFALRHDAEGRLWVGGGSGTGFVGRLEGSSLVMVESSFDAPVTMLDPGANNDLVVAGFFTTIGATPAAKIARWDGTSWRALGDLPGSPTAIAHDASRVYASTFNDGTGALLLGAFDGTTWTDLAGDAGITPQDDYNFNSLRLVGDSLLAVGSAVRDDNTGRGAFLYRGGTLRPLGGGGVHAITVSDIAPSHDAVWVGGVIAEGATSTGAVSSVGVARLAIAR